MADITNVPYSDIRNFILSNNLEVPTNKNSAYELGLSLLKNKNSKGRSLDLVLWSFAYNLLKNNVNVNTYTSEEIDNMSLTEINKLSKYLNMKHNNVNNIKKILKYLHKLNDVELISDVKDLIFDLYEQIKIEEINDYSSYDDLIFLLKTHYNKNLVRLKINEYLIFIMDINISDGGPRRRPSTLKFIYDLLKLKEIGLARKAIEFMSEYEKEYDGSPPMLTKLFDYATEDPIVLDSLLKLSDYINEMYGYDITKYFKY